jgi:hypothetical protein
VQAAYAQRERECRQHFVVTSCINQARREQRRALEALRKQLEVLDEAQRKGHAAQRLEGIESKLRAEDARRRQAQVQQTQEQDSETVDLPHSTDSRRTPLFPHAGSASSAHRPSADERQRVAQYDRRQQEADMHRQALARRIAEHASKGKRPAEPLPLLDAASRPASAATR